VFDWRQDLGFDSVCRCCQQRGNLRPHIVWFGEMPLGMSQIEAALARCDLFVSIGTSGNVYPAAGFGQLAQQAGATTVELNLDRTGSVFDEHHYGPATQSVPEFFSNLA
jgi:NAD-dependent deacetylase